MYKTILVHIDATARSRQRTQAAMHLANRFDSHVIGAALTGLSPYAFKLGGRDVDVPAILYPIEQMRREATQALDVFDAQLQVSGLRFERRLIDEEAGLGLSLQGRYSDLVVISQCAPDADQSRPLPDFPDYVLLHCARPVLVLPPAGAAEDLGQRIAVAWNGSGEAVRAITSALPILKQAAQVDLVVFDARRRADGHGDEPGADMALYLARHGVPVEVATLHAKGNDGESLLSYAAQTGADLIVMGAYGHARLREVVLGGVTRTVLRSAPIALWMAH